jgi:glycosyltransferase involved in cell wall biosynthesis
MSEDGTSPLRLSLDATAVPARPAGAGRYVVSLAAALAQRDDVDLTVLARRDDGSRWRARASGAHVEDTAPVPRPSRLAWEQVRLPGVLRRAGVAVHHGPHYTMPARPPVPTVVTVHDLTFFDHPEWHERAKVVVFRQAIRLAARRADALVCVSHTTADRLRALLAPAVPVHVIPHGVDHDRFRPDPPPATDDAAVLAYLGVRPPYVAFVGTIEPRKGVPALVAAFDRVAARHPDLTLVLAGGKGWDGGATRRAVEASRHAARVRTTGYVGEEAVPALLRGAAVVAYPSLEEGFGLPVLEALACGAPVVTSSGSAMEEVAGDAALLVPPGEVDALAAALDAVLTGDAGTAARRDRGLVRAGDHTWEVSAAAHVAVYRSVAR